MKSKMGSVVVGTTLLLLGGCGGPEGSPGSASNNETTTYLSEDACARANQVQEGMSDSEIHDQLVEAYAVAGRAAPSVKESIGTAVDIFSGGKGDLTKALIDVTTACSEAEATEDWTAQANQGEETGDDLVGEPDDYATTIKAAKTATAICKEIVKEDPTLPPGEDDFLVYCFQFDIQEMLIANPGLTPKEAGARAAREAIAKQEKYGY